MTNGELTLLSGAFGLAGVLLGSLISWGIAITAFTADEYADWSHRMEAAQDAVTERMRAESG